MVEIYGYHRQVIEERLKEDGFPLYLYDQASSFCREMSGTSELFHETETGMDTEGQARDGKCENDSAPSDIDGYNTVSLWCTCAVQSTGAWPWSRRNLIMQGDFCKLSLA